MISPGPEDYEELKEQIERAYKLDPKRKELIRDRISELEFQREENKTMINVAIPFIGGILTAYLVVFVAQGKNLGEQYAPVIFTILFSAIMIHLILSWVEKKDKPYQEKIQKNYDILLGRKP